MFDSLFNKNKNKSISDDVDVIEKIHDEFFTEVIRLKEYAKNASSLSTNKQTLIDKCNRLKSLGFVKTVEITEAEKEIERLKKLETENASKSQLLKAIEYFTVRYPNYRFIDEFSVKNICAKYSLIYGSIAEYKGSVPDKNLEHIEKFKIDEFDECYFYRYYFLSKNIICSRNEFLTHKNSNSRHDTGSNTHTGKAALEIVAPASDFDLTEHEIKDFKLTKKPAPDPIVLKPVIYNQIKYYLIVTAWGLESNDDVVINHNMN